MPSTRSARVAVVAFAVLAVACGDITRQKATYTNALQSYSVYALTGSSSAVPNALSLLGGTTRASSTFSFDIAFDLDSNNRPVIYPVRSLGGALAGTLKYVGLQPVAGGFDALTQAPAAGYDSVNAQTVAIGSVLAVMMRDPTACYSVTLLTSQYLYGKIIVDSVNVAARHLYGRTVIDPNCGYLGLMPDSIPTT